MILSKCMMEKKTELQNNLQLLVERTPLSGTYSGWGKGCSRQWKKNERVISGGWLLNDWEKEKRLG
jgi:hypothetical protein